MGSRGANFTLFTAPHVWADGITVISAVRIASAMWSRLAPPHRYILYAMAHGVGRHGSILIRCNYLGYYGPIYSLEPFRDGPPFCASRSFYFEMAHIVTSFETFTDQTNAAPFCMISPPFFRPLEFRSSIL